MHEEREKNPIPDRFCSTFSHRMCGGRRFAPSRNAVSNGYCYLRAFLAKTSCGVLLSKYPAMSEVCYDTRFKQESGSRAGGFKSEMHQNASLSPRVRENHQNIDLDQRSRSDEMILKIKIKITIFLHTVILIFSVKDRFY